MSEKWNRRQYIKENFRSSFQFLGAIIGATIEQERTFIRPPGSGDELAFLATCTRCGTCADVCPTNTISLFSVEYGSKLAGTPFLNPNEVPCDFCSRCIDYCPTGALEPIAKNEKLGIAEMVQFNCLAFKGTMCDYCVRACPLGTAAITIEDGIPIINEKNCNGCGHCVSACVQTHKGIYVRTIE